jgi:hypothetical protein
MEEQCPSCRICSVLSILKREEREMVFWLNKTRAAIQRQGSILAWTVILSVYGADTIAIDLPLSALIS